MRLYLGGHFEIMEELRSRNKFFYYITDIDFVNELLKLFAEMTKTKKRSVYLPKRVPLVLIDNDSDNHTVGTLASVAAR